MRNLPIFRRRTEKYTPIAAINFQIYGVFLLGSCVHFHTDLPESPESVPATLSENFNRRYAVARVPLIPYRPHSSGPPLPSIDRHSSSCFIGRFPKSMRPRAGEASCFVPPAFSRSSVFAHWPQKMRYYPVANLLPVQDSLLHCVPEMKANQNT